MLVCWTTILFLQLSWAFPNNNNPGYQYGYYVRDVNTGDYKTQEESRVGDTVRGSYTVGEPNGDLRVVTYHADKNTGFNANVQVQPGGVQLLNSDYNHQTYPELMRSIPRYQKRTGFPQLEIKVVPPLSQLFQTKPTVLPSYKNIEETKNVDNEKTLEASNPEIIQTTTEQSVGGEDTTKDVFTEVTTTMNVPDINETVLTDDMNHDLKLSKESNDYKQHLCEIICKQKPEEEGSAYIKPNEDKVQVEMEQVIRAEMPEPTAINMGVPYKQHTQQNHKQYYSQENPMKYKLQEQSQAASPTKNFNVHQQMLPPSFYQSKFFLLPFNMNVNNHDYVTMKNPSVHQQRQQLIKEDENEKQFSQGKQIMQSTQNYPSQATNQQQTNLAHIYPVYTSGIAFLVMPRM